MIGDWDNQYAELVMLIELPFPAASLSGHAKGGWWKKVAVTAKHREWARVSTLSAKVAGLPASGDIGIHFKFNPPDRRGDRTNFPNRLKPYIDGIAEALGVNDTRFLPSYEFGDPVKGGNVTVSIFMEVRR